MRFGPPALLVTLLTVSTALAQTHDPAMHHHEQAQATSAKTRSEPSRDTRQIVRFPTPLREHTLGNMRDHLLVLQKIQEALAKQEYDQASDIAEQRLGMSSLTLHGAHEVAKYMPAGMRDAGNEMHRSASRFAVAAKDAGATGDVKPALDALSTVTAQCVACHAGYRFK